MIFAETGTRVRWLHSRISSDDKGWAGPGLAVIRDFEHARRGFGPGPLGSGTPGPAFEIELEHNHLRAWVGPDDLEAFAEVPS